MPLDSLAAHLDNPNLFRWVSLHELKGNREIACIDGRHQDCVVGAPGGNMGEFILLLGAVERLAGRSWRSAEIKDLLAAFIGHHRRFYMHTDSHAQAALWGALLDDPRFFPYRSRIKDPTRLLPFIRQPPEAVRDALAAYLVRPEFVGCGHLRLMLEKANQYGLRQSLVADAMGAFFQLLWEGHRLDWTVLEGAHEEQAVVTIDIDGELDDESLVPTLCRDEPTPRVFVHHWGVRRYMQGEAVRFLQQTLPQSLLAKLDARRLCDTLAELAERQLAATVRHLGRNLPSYRVTVKAPKVSVKAGDSKAA